MEYNKSPYRSIPEELYNNYTLNNKIPIIDKYYDGTNDLLNNTWSNEYILKYKNEYSINNINNNNVKNEPYKNASKMLLYSFQKYNLRNKNIGVLGSTAPWIEGILLNLNCNITTIDYNIPINNTNLLNIKSYDDFITNNIKYDVIVSYSSIEHSGLGRYGDTLNPNGDLETMTHIYNNLIDDGLLILGVPIGKDILVWNAHRIYGKIRLQLLFKNFKELDWIGFNKSKILSQNKLKNIVKQPVIVLQKQ